MRIPLGADMPPNSRSVALSSIDAFLTQCTRQGYLERHRAGGTKVGANKKRGRAITQGAGNGESEGETWEWKWGPRAMAEVGERDIAHFMAEFMVDSILMGEDDDEGGEANAANEARRKRLETMMKGIERASGGGLADLTAA